MPLEQKSLADRAQATEFGLLSNRDSTGRSVCLKMNHAL
jgi:hypothetical protein